MKQILCCLLCISISSVTLLTNGCAGHDPNPVPAYIPGDEKKSCNVLKAEMSQIQTEIDRKQQQKQTKDIWNVAEFVGGFFLIIPWFFMDIKGAEKAEAEALKRRYNHLGILAADKGCNLTGVKPNEKASSEEGSQQNDTETK